MITKEMIFKAEHDLISDTYDWMNDSDVNEKGKIQYVLGAHDMAIMLLAKMKESEE